MKCEREKSNNGKSGNHDVFLPYRKGIHVEGLKKKQKSKKDQGYEENGQRVELQIVIERVWLIQDFEHGLDFDDAPKVAKRTIHPGDSSTYLKQTGHKLRSLCPVLQVKDIFTSY